MSSDPISAIGLRTAETAAAPTQRQTLGQQDFLTLLVTQLRNQDPLNPLDNEAFVAQLAQFSTVSGISEMSATLGRIEALQTTDRRAAAAAWIGRTVASTDGTAGRVQSVEIAGDGALSLLLEDGGRLAADAVASLS